VKKIKKIKKEAIFLLFYSFFFPMKNYKKNMLISSKSRQDFSFSKIRNTSRLQLIFIQKSKP